MSTLTRVKNCARAIAILALATLGGCASFYVDTGLKDLKPADMNHVANPKPVQLVFEFQTKGVANGQGTDELKPMVLQAVQGSGVFSQVADGPVADGALLHISINNVPLTDDAFAKGFMTGFTFGLVGSTVGDGYICKIDYLPGQSGSTIEETTRSAIYTSLGATASKPANAQKVGSIQDALNIMTREIVANGLNNLAGDPAFGK